jgi:hypothetical protein
MEVINLVREIPSTLVEHVELAGFPRLRRGSVFGRRDGVSAAPDAIGATRQRVAINQCYLGTTALVSAQTRTRRPSDNSTG